MKKPFTLLIMLFTMTSALTAQEINLDQVLQNYFKASAIDKLQSVNTIISTGTLVQQDIMPLKTIRMRPDKFLQEFDVADMTAYQAFDGTTAWMTAPWTGTAKPQPMPEDRMKDIRVKADFDGLLVHSKAKGHQVELAGTDTVAGALAYKLKVIRKDGGIEYYSIDKQSFMLVKRQYSRMIRGKETRMDVLFCDYRDVQGIPFAFTMENLMEGQSMNTVQLESIVLNKPVEEKVFKMPEK